MSRKNHKMVNGRLLQTDKKWSHLKERQKTWIYEVTKEEYDKFIEKNKKQPHKKSKLCVVDSVYERINEKEIWIPYREAKANISKFIDRQNRRSNVAINDTGDVVITKASPNINVSNKPKIPQLKFNELADDIKQELVNKMLLSIGSYINQTHKLPPNKIRDRYLKILLQEFNKKQIKNLGYKIVSDENLVAIYDTLKTEQFSNFRKNGKLPLDTKMERHRKSLIVIETDRLILRKMETNDWRDISSIISDIEVMYAWEKVFTTRQETFEWIIKQCRRYKNEKVGYFLAIEKFSGNTIGQIGLMWNDIENKRCLEVGYILKKEYWHKGFATEGALACLKFGFHNLNIEQIYATIRPENESSIAVAEKIGMSLVGEYTKVYDDKPMKHLIYSLSK